MPAKWAIGTVTEKNNMDANDDNRSIADDERSGAVRFDDRGNAVWETWRGKRLEHPGLSIADDVTFGPGAAPRNKVALKVGYNPYESGPLGRDGYRRKKDLRALSDWIEQQRALGKPVDK